MVSKLKSAAIIGSGALAYKLLTRKPLLTDENIRNGTIGAVVSMYATPKLESVVREGTTDEKKLLRDTVLGGVGGAALGYVIARVRKSNYDR